jgi:methylmalonyl-CoA/ethylmalonyl-CoA epimerase
MSDSEDTRFRLAVVGQIAIPVTDIDRAIGFYRDTLGMQFLFQAPPGLGFFDCSGVRLLLDSPAKELAGKSSTIYFKVADIHEAFEIMSSRGAVFEQDPHVIAEMPDHDLWMAFFRDPDSNLLALMSEVPR